jgi:hypothetical protein
MAIAEVVSSSDVAIYKIRNGLLDMVRSKEISFYWKRVENGLLYILKSSAMSSDGPKWLDERSGELGNVWLRDKDSWLHI